MDQDYALVEGVTFVPIEFPEQNNDIMLNASNDCLSLQKTIALRQTEIQNETDHLFGNLYKNLQASNYLSDKDIHPSA